MPVLALELSLNFLEVPQGHQITTRCWDKTCSNHVPYWSRRAVGFPNDISLTNSVELIHDERSVWRITVLTARPVPPHLRDKTMAAYARARGKLEGSLRCVPFRCTSQCHVKVERLRKFYSEPIDMC